MLLWALNFDSGDTARNENNEDISTAPQTNQTCEHQVLSTAP